jgi:hypothetical protein
MFAYLDFSRKLSFCYARARFFVREILSGLTERGEFARRERRGQ